MKVLPEESIKITAVVCTHNRSDVLPKAIESLLTQSLPAELYEVLVIDNASSDGTAELCKKYIAQGSFRYIYEPVPGLSQARNRGLKEARGKYVAYMDDDAIASDRWLEKLVTCFESATPSPASVGGRIEPIWEAPEPHWLPSQKKPYLTILDYGEEPFYVTYPKILYGTNMAFNKEALKNIGGFRTDVGRVKHCLLSGEEMEVYRQLAEKNLPVYYLPSASVRHLVPKSRLTKKWLYSRHYWQGRSEILVLSPERSRQSLVEEVRTTMKSAGSHFSGLVKAPFRQGDPTYTFLHTSSLFQQLGRLHQLATELRKPGKADTERKRMLVISRSLPRYDRGSGHLRLYHILEILAPHYQIAYLTENYSNTEDCNDDFYISVLSTLGIEVAKGYNSLGVLLKRNHDVVLFEFYDTAIRHLQKVKARLPNASIVIDSVDVHFAREIQMAHVHQDPKLLESALQTKTKELGIYKKCDLVWAVTDEDRKALLGEVQNLNVDVVPNIHKHTEINRSNIEKNSLLFIGNFWHQPNEDAVVYFCKDVLPLIKKEIKDLTFYIVGNAPTKKVKELADETVKVVGWVPETTPYLEKCHVSVVPLRYGAGMKGKVGEAMSAGIPVVTTPVGVQGMDVVHGSDILVSSSPGEFASNVLLLMEDEELYSRISYNASKYIMERYGFDVVASSVITSIKNVKNSHSKQQFTSIEIARLLWNSVTNRNQKLNSEDHQVASTEEELSQYTDTDAMRSFSGLGEVLSDNIDEDYQCQRVTTKLAGVSPAGQWSFGCTHRYKLASGLTYHFIGQMLIRNVSESSSFYKCELYDGKKWLNNFDTNHYDISQKGTWQNLFTSFFIPNGISAVIRITVEKRPLHKDVSGDILLGQIKLAPIAKL